MNTYTITVTDDYIAPEGAIDTNEAYLIFVLNRAAESYMVQYGTATVEEGITAAREAYNAVLPEVPSEA